MRYGSEWSRKTFRQSAISSSFEMWSISRKFLQEIYHFLKQSSISTAPWKSASSLNCHYKMYILLNELAAFIAFSLILWSKKLAAAKLIAQIFIYLRHPVEGKALLMVYAMSWSEYWEFDRLTVLSPSDRLSISYSPVHSNPHSLQTKENTKNKTT